MIYNNFIPNASKPEITQFSIERRIDKKMLLVTQ